MRVSNKSWQMTERGYDILAEDVHDYAGPVMLAKGGSSSGSLSSQTIDPATQARLIRQSADVNRTNTSGTYGSSSWSIDPSTGQYTQSVDLDPSQQRQLDTRNNIAESMLGQVGGDVKGLGGAFNYSDSVSPTARASFDNTVSRLQPSFDQQTRDFDQTQANNGIPIGSEAYNKEQQKLEQGQNDQIQGAATGSVDQQNSMDVSQRQQQYSDIANMLATRNTQTPLVGTNSAIDTTGTANMLQGGVNALNNQATARQNSAPGNIMSIIGAFL